MLTRVITSVVALAVFAAVIAAPPMVFQCAVGIIIIAMLYECVHIMTKSVLVKAAGIICGGLIAAGGGSGDERCSSVCNFYCNDFHDYNSIYAQTHRL